MRKTDLEDRMKAHMDTVQKLFGLSPEVEIHQAAVASFFLDHPGIIGISYPAAEVLMKEKDIIVRNAAMNRVIEELKKRRDINAPNFCFVRRGVSENQVRKILNDVKTGNGDKKVIKANRPPKSGIRTNVISFRGTESEEDAIAFLANRCGISKSSLVEILIEISNRYGIDIKE